MTNPRRPAFLAVLLLAFAGNGGAAVHDANEGLSVDRGRSAERRGPEILHPLRVDRARFEAAARRGRSLALPSTDVAAQRARFERSEHRHGDYTWIGKVDTEFGEQAVVITFGRDAVFGTIPQRRGPPLRVETQRGRQWLVEGESRRMMVAGGKDDARIPRAGAGADAGTPPAAYSTTATATGSAPVVDVLVAYTPSLVAKYGSTSAALTRLTYLESLTNQAYADTPANIRIRVVARNALNYTAASDNDTLLDLITYSSSSPVKAQINAWRDQTGADLVSVVRAFDHGTQTSCGVAWIGGYHGGSFSAGWGYSVVSDGTDSGYYCVDQTFAHELGHNMGSHHDIDTAGGDYGAYSYSRGYRRTLSSTSGFATVMAYTDGPQTQLNRFSNPALAACMNQACGVGSSADNARGLTNAAAKVAALRATVAPPATTPSLTVANASVTEGNSGTRTIAFRVALSAASASAVSFDVATANGTATAGSDYVALPATRVSIAAGATTRDIAVTVNGDTAVEGNETFTLALANPSGATLADASGTGTITNDDSGSTTRPSLTIADVTVDEGSSGTRTATFTVKLSAPAPAPVTYSIATANGTASASGDYVARALSGQTISTGASSKPFGVSVRGDTAVEPDETFNVNISNVVGATVADGSAQGTIRNDDLAPSGVPTLTISDPVVTELDSATSMRFEVRLSQPSSSTVTFNVATVAGGTASAGSDYAARSLSGQSFVPGATSKIFTVAVYGDNVAEADETVFVDVTAVSGANAGDARGVGRIVDDD